MQCDSSRDIESTSTLGGWFQLIYFVFTCKNTAWFVHFQCFSFLRDQFCFPLEKKNKSPTQKLLNTHKGFFKGIYPFQFTSQEHFHKRCKENKIYNKHFDWQAKQNCWELVKHCISLCSGQHSSTEKRAAYGWRSIHCLCVPGAASTELGQIFESHHLWLVISTHFTFPAAPQQLSKQTTEPCNLSPKHTCCIDFLKNNPQTANSCGTEVKKHLQISK